MSLVFLKHMFRKLLFILFGILLTASLWAEPAKPGQWRTITLTDGRQVKAQLIGDEFAHFWQTEGGECYIPKGNRFQQVDKQVLIHQAQTARMERQQLRARTRGIGDAHAPYVGKKKGLIILVQFSDLRFSVDDPLGTFNQIVNGENFQEGDFIGSVHDYFLSQSGGVFELDFDVLSPVTMKNGYAYYGQDGEKEGSDKHPGEMVVDACRAVDDQVNFNDYDWDGDYEVDQVFIINAGKGQSSGGSDDTIWPHEWVLEKSYGSKPVFDNIVVNTYACGPELGGSGKLNGIGTICHEFSHCLGLPDTYDTDYNNYYGMGTWDLMCNGSHSGNGYIPPNYTAYEQAYIGWKTPIVLSDRDQVVSGMKTVNDGGDIYQLVNDDYPNEYFLLENRQQKGWDAALAGSGLLVTHVDFDPDVWEWNAVNTVGGYYKKGLDSFHTDHQYLTIVPADGEAYKGTESTDCYPLNLKDSISNTSSPAFTLYHAKTDGSTLLGKAITGIRQNADGTIDFRFRAVDTNTQVSLSGVVFRETFSQCSGVGGNDGSWSEAVTSAFLPDNKGWNVVAENGCYQCARFGNAVKKGTVTTPKFGVSGDTKLTFRAAPFGNNEMILGINAFGSGDISISQTSFTLAPGQWTDCEAIIHGEGEVSIRFTPSANRLFLDEIVAEVLSSSTSSSIQEVRTSSADTRIYDLHGCYLGTDPTTLRKGIYIIGGMKVVK